jgi:RNA polymerase sigma-70 factor (ECF subfamily)
MRRTNMDNGACSYRRFLDGDESAFDEIMESLFFSLVFFVDRYVRDVHTAEDIAMDVFSDLIAHRHRYNFKVSLKTYLFMLGRNRALDWLRHRKVMNVAELSEETTEADGQDLEEAVIKEETKLTVNKALKQLPEDMQIVIHLIYFEEMSYNEAAKVMKRNTKQIDNLLYRAKKQLRIILGEDGESLL